MLLDYYYSIEKQQTGNEATRFRIKLKTDCTVYQGHFPDMPVAPGVCNIQMIKECTEQLTGRLLLEYISQCKLTTLITPQQHPELDLYIQLIEQDDNLVKIKATLGQETEEYLVLKGECKVLN